MNKIELENFLKLQINNYKENFMFRSSVKISEKLYEISPSLENKIMLAENYLLNKNYYSVIKLLKNRKIDKEKYLLALSYYKLKNYNKAFNNLFKIKGAKNRNEFINIINDNLTDDKLNNIINGHHGYYLLGQVLEKQCKSKEAYYCYKVSFKLDPFNMNCYEKILKLEENDLSFIKNINTCVNDCNLNLFSKNYKPENDNNFIIKLKKDTIDRRANQSININNDKLNIDNIFINNSNINLIKKYYKYIYNIIKKEIYCLNDPLTDEIEFLTKIFKYNIFIKIYEAKINFNYAKYQISRKYFEEIYSKYPHITLFMDYYSTCLWYLKDNIELLKLCINQKKLIDHKHWLIYANYMSLNNDPQTSIKFIERAIQIKSNYSYAWNLIGNEYIILGKYEKAELFYKKSLVYENKNFNAWWGLGCIYLKQDNIQQAINLFKKSEKFNQYNYKIKTYLGISYNLSKNHNEALKCFIESEKLHNNFYLNRIQKSISYFHLNNFKSALDELLTNNFENNNLDYYVLLAKIYQKLGEKEKSKKTLFRALELDHENKKIKWLLQNLEKELNIQQFI